jgi:hypothetical protein
MATVADRLGKKSVDELDRPKLDPFGQKHEFSTPTRIFANNPKSTNKVCGNPETRPFTCCFSRR